ncbi:hypothetical protein FVEG_13493 [Fusarium verticillioides 7600]|uniref:Uncharacterized protein n=1 Tax=Gibberella moniliformis (strain M3125 / FGSC 7600) TaxID=334819 RepID=W7MW48_GIBM7|nr:hypothetical protein FVEG_13493 [Fusarium verticillioides 7600]EWG55501.1 hypothetical protein FVEG_13493 [Fusarium verticillioides 7600]
MTTASLEEPKSGANVDILKMAQQLQHLAHFLSQGHPVPGLSVSEKDLKAARVLSPVTNVTSHRRHSDLGFPREWVEDDVALAIALREWRRDIDPMQLSSTPLVDEKPAQTTVTPTEAEVSEADIEAHANGSFLSHSMKGEAHWVAKLKELEKKLRQTEQEKESVVQKNVKLQRDVEALQRQSESFRRALFDPKRKIHENNLKVKVKLNGEIRQLQSSLTVVNSKNESLVEKNKELKSCNTDLVMENEELLEKNTQLESCNKTLVTENKDLVKKTKKLELSNFDLLTENAAFDTEIKRLDSDHETLITMAQKFLDKHALSTEATKKHEETLVAENQALRRRSKALVKVIAAMKLDSKRCAAQVEDLDSSKDFLAAHNNDLSIRNAALGDKGKRLEETLNKIVMDAKCSLGG